MKTIDIAEAAGSLAEYVLQAMQEPVVITQKGKPLAALLPIENADLETVTLATNPKFLALIGRSRARQREEGGIATEEIRRRLKLSL